MEKMLFYHGETTDNVRFTIAGHFEEDEIILGLALCSKNDQFCKKLGSIKAAGRSYSKRGRSGMSTINLYKDTMPENYWVGKETRIFRDAVSNFENMKSLELKQEFNF